MRDRRGLDFASAQFETVGQYDALIIGSLLPLGIGNPSELNDARLADAIRRTNAGTIALIGEVLHPDPSYSARGIPISSACFYVDMDEAQGGYRPLADFAVMPAGMRATCSVYAGGALTDADWDVYQAWTRLP